MTTLVENLKIKNFFDTFLIKEKEDIFIVYIDKNSNELIDFIIKDKDKINTHMAESILALNRRLKYAEDTKVELEKKLDDFFIVSNMVADFIHSCACFRLAKQYKAEVAKLKNELSSFAIKRLKDEISECGL